MKDTIKNIILNELGIDIQSKSRKKEVIEARALFFYCVKQLQKRITLQELGDYCGILHCSVIHSIKNYEMYENYNDNLYNIRQYIIENYNKEEESIYDLKKEIFDLKQKLKENEYSYDIIKKLNELLVNHKENKETLNVLIDRLESFYVMNSKLKF